MVEQMISRRVLAVQRSLHSFVETVLHSPGRGETTEIANFMTGDPQELPPAGFVESLQRCSVPTGSDWFAYRFAHEPARAAVAASLTAELGADVAPEDIFLTRGAAGAIALALHTVVDPGDEVVFVSPPWFFYEAMILSSGASPIRVRLEPPAFDLDVEAITAVLGPRTRAVLINTPHNPTGRIYPAAVLQRLADALAKTAQRHGRPIWVISDEAYSRILFDERNFISPGAFHPYSLLARTYSKSTLTPGQRLGYLALAPDAPHAEAMRKALFHALVSCGLAMPDAVMQYALPDINGLLIDIAALQRRRDRMVAALRQQGYQLHSPEATFYLLPQTPVADDRAFCALLAEHGVAVLPGHVIDLPGYFRICLTATDEAIERSLPHLRSRHPIRKLPLVYLTPMHRDTRFAGCGHLRLLTSVRLANQGPSSMTKSLMLSESVDHTSAPPAPGASSGGFGQSSGPGAPPPVPPGPHLTASMLESPPVPQGIRQSSRDLRHPLLKPTSVERIGAAI